MTDQNKKVKTSLYVWEEYGFDSEKEFLERYPNAPRESLSPKPIVVEPKLPEPTQDQTFLRRFRKEFNQ